MQVLVTPTQVIFVQTSDQGTDGALVKLELSTVSHLHHLPLACHNALHTCALKWLAITYVPPCHHFATCTCGMTGISNMIPPKPLHNFNFYHQWVPNRKANSGGANVPISLKQPALTATLDASSTCNAWQKRTHISTMCSSMNSDQLYSSTHQFDMHAPSNMQETCMTVLASYMVRRQECTIIHSTRTRAVVVE